MELSQKVGADIGPENINEAYFIRNKTASKEGGLDQKSSIVVKISSMSAKQKLMAVKLKLNENMNIVLINDFLSKETLNLYNYARALKEVVFSYVYSTNGTVFYKRSEISKSQIVRSEEDLDKILLNSVTGKPLKRRLMVSVANTIDPRSSGKEAAAYDSPKNI